VANQRYYPLKPPNLGHTWGHTQLETKDHTLNHWAPSSWPWLHPLGWVRGPRGLEKCQRSLLEAALLASLVPSRGPLAPTLLSPVSYTLLPDRWTDVVYCLKIVLKSHSQSSFLKVHTIYPLTSLLLEEKYSLEERGPQGSFMKDQKHLHGGWDVRRDADSLVNLPSGHRIHK
jgi:hypothetical protein